MAALKVAQFRATLDAFADLYDNVGAAERASALRELSKALQKADKRTVDEIFGKLNTTGHDPPDVAKVAPRH